MISCSNNTMGIAKLGWIVILLALSFTLVGSVAFAIQPGDNHTILEANSCQGEASVRFEYIGDSGPRFIMRGCGTPVNNTFICDCSKEIAMNTFDNVENVYKYKVRYYLPGDYDLEEKPDYERTISQRLVVKENEFKLSPELITFLWIIAGLVLLIGLGIFIWIMYF